MPSKKDRTKNSKRTSPKAKLKSHSRRRPIPTENEHIQTALHVAIVATPLGVIVGTAIAGYDYIVSTIVWDSLVAKLSPTQLCLMPFVGMLLAGLIITIFKVSSTSMADEIVSAYHNPKLGVDYRSAMPKLMASIATIGFGCSAGMEGASKWLGGAISGWIQSLLNRVPWLKAAHGRVELTMLAGAAAGIGAIFRAPLTGAIMGLESPYKKDFAHDALIHGLVASAVSYTTFALLRNSNAYFPIHFQYHINLRDLVYCIPLGIFAGLSSHLFLALLKFLKTITSGDGLQPMLRFLIGGILLSGLAFVANTYVADGVTLQSGMPIANKLLSGHFTGPQSAWIWIAKILATAITFGFGGVGGLFVPSATIGAALGAVCDVYFAPSQPGLFTLVGIAAFTGASYNSLLFAAVFVAEATGNPALVVPGLIASSTAFLVSVEVSNSPSQISGR